MPNLRIVHDNVADTSSTLTASTTSGTLVAQNMLNEYKTQVHRSTGTNVTYELTWTTAVTVGCVALPATNLSGDALIRVQLYSQSNFTGLLEDTGQIFATPGLDLDMWDWSQPLNVNSFAYGGAAKTTVWFTNQQLIKSCRIILTDINNSVGYIDCARLVIGNYWEPEHTLERGFEFGTVDMSTTSRADSGTLIADRGIVYESISFNFAILSDSDRSKLSQILRKLGTHRNFLLSAMPDDSSSAAKQDLIIYGKRVNSMFSNQVYGYYKHSMQIVGW